MEFVARAKTERNYYVILSMLILARFMQATAKEPDEETAELRKEFNR